MVNATIWLEQNYPENSTCTRVADTENYGKNRSQIINLDVSNQSLEGYLHSGVFTNLKRLNASFNELTNESNGLTLQFEITGYLEDIDWSHNSLSYVKSFSTSDTIKKLNFSFNNLYFLVVEDNLQLTHLDFSNKSCDIFEHNRKRLPCLLKC